MLTTIRDIIAAIAGAALAFVIVSIYWQGIPLLNDRTELSLPFVGAVKVSSLPILGPLAVGHLQLRIDQAVVGATADMVKRVELRAAQARLEEIERQRAAATQSLEEYRRRADADRAANEQINAERERERLTYAIKLDSAKRRCDVDGADIEFLQRNNRPPSR